jgi:uncharacterized protein
VTRPDEERASAEFTPFWDAALQGKLRLPVCSQCGAWRWLPGTCRNNCVAPAEWAECSGRGIVYAHTTVRRAPTAAFEAAVPYVLALIELEEGPRLLAHVVRCDPMVLSIGLPVRVSFEAVESSGLVAPVFVPEVDI